jgi:hypothetical protein
MVSGEPRELSVSLLTPSGPALATLPGPIRDRGELLDELRAATPDSPEERHV